MNCKNCKNYRPIKEYESFDEYIYEESIKGKMGSKGCLIFALILPYFAQILIMMDYYSNRKKLK